MLRRYILPGRPYPFARHRGTGRGGINPATYAAWQHSAAVRLRNLDKLHEQKPLKTPVAVRVVVSTDQLLIEVGSTDLERPLGIRGDLDNYAKAALDALQKAGVIDNDRDVLDLEAFFR